MKGRSRLRYRKKKMNAHHQTTTQSLYQISTSTALVEGVHSGSVSSSVLLEHGDFGLGTFEGLDGERVILDRQFYQVPDGVRHRTDNFPPPSAPKTSFRAK